MAIHPTALIDPSAHIDSDVEVGAYAVIEGPTTIGRENKIFQFASIGAAPQDLKYKGEPTRLEIGDRNLFRENCTINRGTTKDKLVTRIGNDNLFMAGSHVGHDCVIGSHCVFANYATLGGHVEIGDWVHMGGFSGVHQFCKVGAHAFIANNTAVTRDVPPYVMAVGRPAEPHSVNAEGLKRRGFTPEQIRNIREAYKTLYRSRLKLAEAMAQLEERARTQPELVAFVAFLHESTPRRERVGIVR
jgi:UDP-N-acetylglucosamine acyltransferase